MFCGVDEAGRGSVMGPLVVGAVYVESDDALKKIGVKDSKKLSPKLRERMYDEICVTAESYCTVIVSASEIDEKRRKMSLNTIELEMFQDATSRIKTERIYADCPDSVEMTFSSALSVRVPGPEIIARHRADDTYPVVSAASIIAKVTRDRIIEDISKEFGTDVGSGYPSDHFTMEFIEKWIKDNGRPPEHTRCSWEPVKHLISTSRNTKLSDW